MARTVAIWVIRRYAHSHAGPPKALLGSTATLDQILEAMGADYSVL